MADDAEDYTAAHVQEALAQDRRVNEPELEVQIVGNRVFVTGTVPTAERRDAVAEVVRERCPGFEVENRTTVAHYPDADGAERVR
ncbi:MAG TPA: BON domain-containing protein [Actinomycetota bacterium]